MELKVAILSTANSNSKLTVIILDGIERKMLL